MAHRQVGREETEPGPAGTCSVGQGHSNDLPFPEMDTHTGSSTAKGSEACEFPGSPNAVVGGQLHSRMSCLALFFTQPTSWTRTQ
jgi:hypothetical protein